MLGLESDKILKFKIDSSVDLPDKPGSEPSLAGVRVTGRKSVIRGPNPPGNRSNVSGRPDQITRVADWLARISL
jgi:hypothetical protein